MVTPTPVGPGQQVAPLHPFIPFPPEDVKGSIVNRFEKMVAQYPHHLAIQTQTEKLSYAALNREANRLARAIVEQRGEAAEPICLLLGQGMPVLVGIMAVLKAGKFFVSLDPASPADTRRHILEDTGAGFIVTDRQHLSLARDLAQAGGQDIINLEELSPSLSVENLDVTSGPDSLTYIIYTSGSTGQPKGVVRDHRSILFSNMSGINQSYMSHADRQMLISSTAFGGTMGIIFQSLLVGGAVCIYDLAGGGLNGLRDWLIEQEITVYHSVPPVFRHLAASLPTSTSFPKLRLIKLTGDVVYKKDVELFQRHFGDDCLFRLTLASTEAPVISSYMIGKHTRLTGSLVPVGYTASGVQVMLLDETGQDVGGDNVGEIAVKSRYLCRGYWRNPELTRAKFLPDPAGGDERIYLTGDLGRWRPDGLLEHLGRKDFQVKIRGYRVELPEIEMALLDLEPIQDAAVVARPDPAGEPRLVAYVVPQPSSTLTARQVRVALAERLPDYKVPPLVIFLEALPRLPNGKLDRQALPTPGAARPDLEADFTPPQNPFDTDLVRIWEEVLHIRPVGIHDDFFELGGDSLAAARIFAEIEKRWDRKLPPTTMLAAPTVDQLATLLQQEGPATALSSLVPLQPHGDRPPLVILHGLGGGSLEYVPLARALGTLAPDWPVYGLPMTSDANLQAELPRFETMVSVYVDQLLAFRPAGPFLLAGYSYGSIVAFEAAQQLHRRGHQVVLLAMIDMPAPNFKYHRVRWGSGLLLPFLRNFPHWLAALLRVGPVGIYNRGRKRFQYLLRRGWYVIRGRRGAYKRNVEDFVDDLARVPSEYQKIMVYLARVKKGYQPQKYPGKVTLFRAQAQAFLCSFDPQMGWGELALGGVEVREIEGSHLELLRDPFVGTLARQLQACMEDSSRAAGQRDDWFTASDLGGI
ncbi:MAG: alpha/beta fold hydrolase [Chloroflexi bacterium]|nr:alpha/beta fold hydrolase [Chloroflexota bacterium]